MSSFLFSSFFVFVLVHSGAVATLVYVSNEWLLVALNLSNEQRTSVVFLRNLAARCLNLSNKQPLAAYINKRIWVHPTIKFVSSTFKLYILIFFRVKFVNVKRINQN